MDTVDDALLLRDLCDAVECRRPSPQRVWRHTYGELRIAGYARAWCVWSACMVLLCLIVVCNCGCVWWCIVVCDWSECATWSRDWAQYRWVWCRVLWTVWWCGCRVVFGRCIFHIWCHMRRCVQLYCVCNVACCVLCIISVHLRKTPFLSGIGVFYPWSILPQPHGLIIREPVWGVGRVVFGSWVTAGSELGVRVATCPITTSFANRTGSRCLISW